MDLRQFGEAFEMLLVYSWRERIFNQIPPQVRDSYLHGIDDFITKVTQRAINPTSYAVFAIDHQFISGIAIYFKPDIMKDPTILITEHIRVDFMGKPIGAGTANIRLLPNKVLEVNVNPIDL